MILSHDLHLCCVCSGNSLRMTVWGWTIPSYSDRREYRIAYDEKKSYQSNSVQGLRRTSSFFLRP